MWVEKHRPSNPNTMIGNEQARLEFLRWLNGWSRKNKPALLLGPPGVGKTTLVKAAAHSRGYKVLELNASDVRTKTKLEELLGPTRIHSTLFEEKILVFLDEVDGIYGRQDRGGIEFVQDLIKGSRNPVVMAANVEDDKKIQKLAKVSQVFRFQRIPPRLLEIVVRDILRREGLTLEKETLETIVRNANGDMRAAVNSVQVAVSGDSEILPDVRDIQIKDAEALKLYFGASSSKEAFMALRGWKVQPREKIRTIFRSIIACELEGERLVEALEMLSKTDELVAKIGRTQNYRLLRYFDTILATLVFEVLRQSHVRYRVEDLSWPLQLRIWNEARQLADISRRLAVQHHVSARDAIVFYFPYVALLSRSLNRMETEVIGRLQMDEKLVKVLRKEEQRVAQEVGRQ
jgi:replication factor C large subunit